MTRKRIGWILPAVVLPYVALLCMAVVFLRNPVSTWFMKWIFQNNGLLLLAFFAVFALLSILLSVLCFVMSLRQQWDPISLAKTAMIVKLIQIPAYLIVFVIGVLMILSIFTFAFSVLLWVMDCVTLVLTGMLSVAAAIIGNRKQLLSNKETIMFSLLQLVFVADVVATIVLYRKLAKQEALCSTPN